ncbi:hypothetical protein FWH09_00880 [Candidatus Saccharibacteria bacterium]|nr:hypothetical protein [Candidatus Saccharibacteria bacterium]
MKKEEKRVKPKLIHYKKTYEIHKDLGIDADNFKPTEVIISTHEIIFPKEFCEDCIGRESLIMDANKSSAKNDILEICKKLKLNCDSFPPDIGKRHLRFETIEGEVFTAYLKGKEEE